LARERALFETSSRSQGDDGAKHEQNSPVRHLLGDDVLRRFGAGAGRADDSSDAGEENGAAAAVGAQPRSIGASIGPPPARAAAGTAEMELSTMRENS